LKGLFILTVKELKERLNDFDDDLDVVLLVVGEYGYTYSFDSDDIGKDTDDDGNDLVQITVYE
jgi:hypothetical protein